MLNFVLLHDQDTVKPKIYMNGTYVLPEFTSFFIPISFPTISVVLVPTECM